MTSSRTVTVRTSDQGDVTVPEPAWCRGHDDQPVEALVDLTHRGPEQHLGTDDYPVGIAQFTLHPYGTCTPLPGLYIEPAGDAGTLTPAEADLYAAALVEAAAQVRKLARWLTVVRGPNGGAQ